MNELKSKPKGKAPAFQLYAQDFLVGTASMTAEERGGYISLLCHQWVDGPLPRDEARLSLMSGCAGAVLQLILSKFRVTKRGLVNKRLEIERKKQREHSKQQTLNANKRWHKNGNATAYPPHMPNECSSSSSSSSSSITNTTPQPPGGVDGDGAGGITEHTTPRKPRAPKKTSILPPGFLRFWSAFPNTHRRANRTGCSRIWERYNLESETDAIVTHVEACAKSEQWLNGYGPMAETYLNQRRWDAPPPPEKGVANGNDKQQHRGVSFDADKNLTL